MAKLRRIVVDETERQHNGKRPERKEPTLLRTVLIYGCLFGALIAHAETFEYTVTVSHDLARLDVKARFPASVAPVTSRSRNAADLVQDVEDCERGVPLDVDGRRIDVGKDIRCLSYSVDLDRAADIEDGVRLLPVNDWMWRPRLGGNDEVIVAFALPDGIGVSVPWQPVPGRRDTYRLRSSPQSGTGLALFGEFTEETADVGNADIRIVVVPYRGRSAGPEVIDWTRQTARHVTLAYGRFPSPDARVLVFPASSRRGDSAVQFGRVVRDGGETVELLVDPAGPEEQFLGDWTATHEFAHLLLPFIDRDERWISEGFAQYYQNVLLARAGRYTQLHAWQKINDGLRRGATSAPGLSPNEAAGGGERNARMKIYWSGAALFLIADVELRRRYNGSVTLDTVLERFQACCLPSRRAWSGRELFEAFDSLVDEPLFVELHRRYADSAGFPPFRPLLDQLGIRPDTAGIAFDDSSELAEIRAAITARRYTGEPGR